MWDWEGRDWEFGGMRGSEKAKKRISRYPRCGLLLVSKLVLPDLVSVDCFFSVALAYFSYPHRLGTVVGGVNV